MPEIRTVSGSRTVEIDRIKGSRFIADVAPASDDRAARAIVEAVRAREPDATHHCWAYAMADGTARSSDDGEPRDTAGPPILRRVEGAGLTNVVVVVTRYYGGTNLGRGGLVRAYGAAAGAVLDAAPVVVAHEVQVVDTEYGASVTVDADVPVDELEAFVRAMTDATAGVVSVSRGGALSG